MEKLTDYQFEMRLFNFFTLEYERPELLFSQRRRVVTAMMDTMKAELAVIQAEREAQLPRGPEANG